MMRVIVTPAVLPPSALAELKQWLGISTTLDDGELSALLATALDVCADFIGALPLACDCEETIALRTVSHPTDWQVRRYSQDWLSAGSFGGWQKLSSAPVQQVSGVAMLMADGTRVGVAAGGFEVRLDAEGGCAVRVNDIGDNMRAVVSFTAGLAPDWNSLPQPLHHGIMRLAAHQYRQRETTGGDALPPASVSALWRPFRRMRLV
jgi:uncharacterized phiE125 gp8 family phage protein